jgi:hypothetical protein
MLDHPFNDMNFNAKVDNQVFNLPDSSKIEISKEMFQVPEMMFHQ